LATITMQTMPKRSWSQRFVSDITFPYVIGRVNTASASYQQKLNVKCAPNSSKITDTLQNPNLQLDGRGP